MGRRKTPEEKESQAGWASLSRTSFSPPPGNPISWWWCGPGGTDESAPRWGRSPAGGEASRVGG